MRAELHVVDGCPHTAEAARRYRVALDVTGHNFVPVAVTVIDTVSDPAGPCPTSPTFRLNDVDLSTAPLGERNATGCHWTIPTTSDLADAIGPRRR